MRYYDIKITDPKTGALVREYTSFPNGQTDPAALNIELDVPIAAFATPMGDTGAAIRVWGISLKEIAQASNYNNLKIQVFAGMQKGLPLANPAQAGLIVQGFIWQAFGNWIETNMTLDLIVKSYVNSEVPPNLAFNWIAGTSLQSAITATLKTAYPTYTPVFAISQDLVLPNDEIGFYDDLVQLAQYIKNISIDILDANGSTDYAGVDIIIRGNSIYISDATSPANPKAIAFNDLIGQPTWVGPQEIQVTTVMRADLAINGYIKLPPSQVTTTAQSLSQFRDASVFQGAFRIFQIRHVGNFRQAAGEAWITTFNCFPAAVSDLTPATPQNRGAFAPNG